MLLSMARPIRRDSSSQIYFRKKLPQHLKAVALGKTVTLQLSPASPQDAPLVVSTRIGQEVKFSLQTADPDLAKVRYAEAAVQLDRHFASFLAGPKPLTQKEAAWLAGLVYKGFAEGGEDEPGSSTTWEQVIEANEAAVRGPFMGLGIYPTREEALGAERDAAIERRFGGMADALLRTQGIHTDADGRSKLMLALADAATQAARKLKRNAEGDYRPDPNADRFPKERPHKRTATVPLPEQTSMWAIFERWRKETQPAASTYATFKGHLRRAERFFGHADLARIQRSDVVAWKDEMVAEGLKSVRSGPLATLKTMCKYAVDNGLLKENPALGVTVRQKVRAGERRRAYTTDEVHHILRLAAREQHPGIRWLIWLTALSGSRIAEPAQLWADSIRHERDIWVMDLKPCKQGGSIKNVGSERVVPIHSALIAMGFLDFVATRKGLPLFYAPRKSGWRPEQKHPSKGLTNRAAGWVRKTAGVTDPRVGPTHSFRHWFKTQALRAGQEEALINAVVGHAPKSVGDRYYHPDIQMLRQVVESINVPRELLA